MFRHAVVVLMIGGTSCARPPRAHQAAGSANEVAGSRPADAANPPAAPPRAATFLCTWDGKLHAIRQIGFNHPDAVYALSLSDAERKRLQATDNDDTAVVGGAFFVRGWAPIPISHELRDWGFGFWIQISPQDFADYEQRGQAEHPTYRGQIANQSIYGAPTLGLAAELELRGGGLRPIIRFTDDKHPLARLQNTGVDGTQWREWLSEGFHLGEPAPRGAPFLAALDSHG